MFAEAIETLRETVMETAWKQWAALDAPVSRSRAATSLVDPEALVLISLYLRDHERRLWDVLGGWARQRSALLSVQRIKNLVDQYPDEVAHRLGELASLAVNEGSDLRWRSLSGPDQGPAIRRDGGASARPRVSDPSALLLRLRLGIGVGVKPDVLGVLIGLDGSAARVSTLADATGFAKRSVKRAADEMAEAGLLHSEREGPTEYRVEPSPWAQLLELPVPSPRWRGWHPIYVFCAQALSELQEIDHEEPGRRVASSRLRSLLDAHRRAVAMNRISIPDPDDHPGTAFLEAFDNALAAVCSWMDASV